MKRKYSWIFGACERDDLTITTAARTEGGWSTARQKWSHHFPKMGDCFFQEDGTTTPGCPESLISLTGSCLRTRGRVAFQGLRSYSVSTAITARRGRREPVMRVVGSWGSRDKLSWPGRGGLGRAGPTGYQTHVNPVSGALGSPSSAPRLNLEGYGRVHSALNQAQTSEAGFGSCRAITLNLDKPALRMSGSGRNSTATAPPPPLPLRTQKPLPDAGSSAALLPQGLAPPPRGEDLLPARGGRRLASSCAPEWCPGSVILPDAGAGSSGRSSFWISLVPARGPCGAMNGTANPLLDREEHCLRLGESFEKRPRTSFHTIRCKSALSTVPFGCFSRLLPISTPSSPPRPFKVQWTPCLRQPPSLQILQDLDFLPSPTPATSLLTDQTLCHSQLSFLLMVPNTFSEVHWALSLFIPPPSPCLCQTHSLLPKDYYPTSDPGSSSSNSPPFLMYSSRVPHV